MPLLKPLQVVLLAVAVLLMGCATSNVRLGAAAFDRGEYDQAAMLWNGPAIAGDMYAQYNLGLLWEGGLGSTPRDSGQASHWFLHSAKQGYTPAMVRLANIQLQGGHREAALSWLNLAARWGNADAGQALARIGQATPAADLYIQQQALEAEETRQALLALADSVSRTASSASTSGYRPQPQPQASPPSNSAWTPQAPTTSPSVLSTEKPCASDYACGSGYQCVKGPLQSQGVCMKSVNEYGNQEYKSPRPDSVGPNMDIDGQCQFDTQCPVSFRCDSTLKACVKR
jgi:hypothetical protein